MGGRIISAQLGVVASPWALTHDSGRCHAQPCIDLATRLSGMPPSLDTGNLGAIWSLLMVCRERVS